MSSKICLVFGCIGENVLRAGATTINNNSSSNSNVIQILLSSANRAYSNEKKKIRVQNRNREEKARIQGFNYLRLPSKIIESSGFRHRPSEKLQQHCAEVVHQTPLAFGNLDRPRGGRSTWRAAWRPRTVVRPSPSSTIASCRRRSPSGLFFFRRFEC